MKNKKIKSNKAKLIKPISIAALATTIILPSSLAIAFASNHPTSAFIFQNRRFNSKDEALEYLLRNNMLNINDRKVWGDFASSYSFFEKGILNKNLMPDYDPSKANFVYLNADGSQTNDFQAALQTYYNQGLIVSKYDDGWGNVFVDQASAAQSFKHMVTQSPLGYIDTNFIEHDTLVPHHINPLNVNDVNLYKNNIKDNINSILLDILKHNNENSNLHFAIKNVNNYSINRFIAKNILKQKDVIQNLIPQDGVSIVGSESKIVQGMDQKRNPNNNIEEKISIPSLFLTMPHTYKPNWKTDSFYTGVDRFQGNRNIQFSFNFKDSNNNSINKYQLCISPHSFNDETYASLGYGSGDNAYSSSAYFWHTNSWGWNKDDVGVLKVINDSKDDSFKTIHQIDLIDPTKIKNAIETLLDIITPQSKNMNVNLGGDSNYAHFDIQRPTMENRIEMNLNNDLDQFSNGIKNNISVDKFIKDNSNLFTNSNQFANVIKDDLKNVTFFNKDAISSDFQLKNLPTITTRHWVKHHLIEENQNYIKLDDQEIIWNFDNKLKIALPDFEKAIFGDNNINNAFWKMMNSENNNSNDYDLTIHSSDLNLDFKVKVAFDQVNGNFSVEAIDFLPSGEFKEQEGFKMLASLNQLIEDIKKSSTTSSQRKHLISDFFINNEAKISTWKPVAISSFNAGINSDDNIKILILDLKQIITKAKGEINFDDLINMVPEASAILPVFASSNVDSKILLTKYIISNVNEINPSLQVGQYSGSGFIDSQIKFNNLWNYVTAFTPAQRTVLFDLNGHQVNVGDYEFDAENVLRYNALNALEPRRDAEHIYVYDKIIKNEVHTIFNLKYEQIDLYFDSFAKLKDYVYNEIIEKGLTWV